MAIRGWHWGVLVAALSACQPSSRQPADLEVGPAWARATAPGQDTGGVFLTVRGGSAPDRLVGGSTPQARSVEIHSMRMDGAVMRMRRQPSAAIAADGVTRLAPGGTHLMLVGLKSPLTPGRTFDLTLDFAEAGRRQVAVKVMPIGATGPRDGQDE
jgi:copper(I)-binding protein